jgi:16S rRNA processing protein RimM
MNSRNDPVEAKKYLLVGEIIKPHGIRGEVGVRSLTGRPDVRFSPESELFLGSDENSLRQVVVSAARPFKQGYLLRFDSVSDRNEAEKLRGCRLYVPEDQALKPEEGGYFQHQLIGLTLEDDSGNELGRVAAVLELPVYELLEVSREGKKNFYVPLVEEFVREVDLEAGRLRVSLPEGLMDL